MKSKKQSAITLAITLVAITTIVIWLLVTQGPEGALQAPAVVGGVMEL